MKYYNLKSFDKIGHLMYQFSGAAVGFTDNSHNQLLF